MTDQIYSADGIEAKHVEFINVLIRYADESINEAISHQETYETCFQAMRELKARCEKHLEEYEQAREAEKG